MRISLLPLMLATLFAATGVAHAELGASAASCTVGDPAIQANRYLITGGSISYQTAATGVITIYCRIQGTWVSSPSTFHVTYADTDGTGTNANLTAQIIRMSRSTGTLTTVTTQINSNSFGTTSGSEMTQSLSGVTWDFTNNYYYIRVDLNRSTTSSFSTLFGFALD
jgi:hypothetical protein